jgi:omega-6 fatty acid desaturase (delta-12 desaturase)
MSSATTVDETPLANSPVEGPAIERPAVQAPAAADSAPGRDKGLGSVIKLLPDEVYANPTWKGVAYIARDLVIYVAVVWALISVSNPLLLIPLWILGALAISGLFVLGHDAAHGALFKSDRLNYWLGQFAFLPSLHAFEAWVLGHNRLHHGHTVRREMDFVWHPLTVEEYRALSPMRKLLHKIEWSALGSGIYYGLEVYWKKMVRLDPPAKMAAAIRRDLRIVGVYFALFSAGLFAIGFAGGGGVAGALWMWVKVFLLPWILWNYTIGAVVYVHHIDDTIAWHPRREWTKFKGQMEGTTILHVPAWLNVFLHNIMIHVPHHVDMRIPFYGLPRAGEIILERFPVVREREFGLRDYLRSTRACKLYDFENGAWQTYAAAAEAASVETASATS